MRRQRNMAQMKEQIKTPEKELNKIEIRNLSDAEFNTLVIMMLKKLSEDLNNIKNIQAEMKDILVEIKDDLYCSLFQVEHKEQLVEWMKLRIQSMIWNIRKQKTTNQNNKKIESQKMRIV